MEGALDSLLWWEDDVLCSTPDAVTLPGVTRELLLDLARRRGVRVRRDSPFPAQLAGRETWLTNALYGIRVVTSWGQDAAVAGPAARAAVWREQLHHGARHLDDAAPIAGLGLSR